MTGQDAGTGRGSAGWEGSGCICRVPFCALVRPQATPGVMRSEHAYVRTLLHPRSHLGVLTPRSAMTQGVAGTCTSHPTSTEPPCELTRVGTIKPQEY